MASPRKWSTEWLLVVAGGERRIPAFTFLQDLPGTSRTLLLQVVEAVKGVGGPDQWRDAHLHARMKGDLADLHEARDKQGDTLYRLFLRWDRDVGRVWIIDGRSKPNNTVLSDADYGEIRAQADLTMDDPPPLATTDDITRIVLG
jgi:1,2-phenylacetyl-CoA epoxidase catalytic subunit